MTAPTPYLNDDDVVVYHGDCIDVMRAMPVASVDLLLTDPPYGMGYQSNRRPSETRFDRIANDDVFDPVFNAAWLAEAYRLLRDDTHAYVFTDDTNLGNWRAALADAGFNVKRTMVWDKGGGGIGDLEGDYMHETEFIVYAQKGRRVLDGRRESNIRRVRKVNPNDMVRPTQKPTGLLAPLIEKSTGGGSTILDPFFGSGATGVAARLVGRRCIGVELDERYVRVASDRLAQRSLLSA